ncbi:hypothetical protein [Leuconostoc lactis]|nr:hypothetical protein [Leuconostoc lactis]
MSASLYNLPLESDITPTKPMISINPKVNHTAANTLYKALKGVSARA